MRPYLALINARIRMMLQYRTAALAGLSTQLFWGLIRVMIFEAFYRSTTAQQPMSLDDVITYVWLGQALFALLPWRFDSEVRAMVRSGTVAYELVRPTDLYTFWFSRSIAERIAPTLLRAGPIFVAAFLFLDLQFPASPAAGLAWLAATLGALFLGAAIGTLISISMLWTISGQGLANFLQVAIFIFSGMIIPLPLFPEWCQEILNFLPFRGLVDAPFRLYMGHYPPEAIFPLLGHQLAWTLGLILYGRWLMSRSARRLVVQGG